MYKLLINLLLLLKTKPLDTEIFILLKKQAMEVFIFLLATRRFATENGLQSDVERINTELAESVRILSLVNKQLRELQVSQTNYRIGFFDSVRNVA